MSGILLKLTQDEVEQKSPAFGGVGGNLEWRRCGVPSDGFSRGYILRFHGDEDWYAFNGSIKEHTHTGDYVWADGQEIKKPE